MKLFFAGVLFAFECLLSAQAAFVHPGLYHTASDLAFMSRKVEARAEPWFSAWKQLQADSRLDWVSHAVVNWDANDDAQMHDDAVVAYGHALQWAVGGDQAHAAKAIEILNSWSSQLKSIHGTNSQERLVCGWNACHLANAAEILATYIRPDGSKSGWAKADQARLTQVLHYMASLMRDYKPDFNGNWDAAMMNSMLCIAVYTDDHVLFDSVVDHFHGKYVAENPAKKRNGHLTAYVLPTGQCQESGRDQWHVQMGLGNYIALCEVAWKQGVDLYGAYDSRLAKGVEYAAKYMLGHDDVPFELTPPDPWTKISEGKRGLFMPMWEAAYQHFVFRKGLAMPYTREVVLNSNAMLERRPGKGAYRPEAAYPLVGIGWGTLTMFKGEEDPQAAK